MTRCCLIHNARVGLHGCWHCTGFGDWTAQYIALRQLRDPDAFPSGDVGLINALAALEGAPVTSSQLLLRAQAWRPHRGHAAQHLWASLARAD